MSMHFFISISLAVLIGLYFPQAYNVMRHSLIEWEPWYESNKWMYASQSPQSTTNRNCGLGYSRVSTEAAHIGEKCSTTYELSRFRYLWVVSCVWTIGSPFHITFCHLGPPGPVRINTRNRNLDPSYSYLAVVVSPVRSTMRRGGWNKVKFSGKWRFRMDSQSTWMVHWLSHPCC